MHLFSKQCSQILEESQRISAGIDMFISFSSRGSVSTDSIEDESIKYKVRLEIPNKLTLRSIVRVLLI